MLLDGWHNLAGYRVYIRNGQIVRGMLGQGRDQRPAWLYRYNPRLGVWSSCVSMSVDAFRSGVRRGTVKIA